MHCARFDDIKEVIFEWNTIMPAGTALSWGNNIDNYSGRYAQHVWHAYNNFNTEWGGDREFMTFDPVPKQNLKCGYFRRNS